MQHDSTTFTVLDSKFPSKRTHQPADRVSSLRQRHASSPFFGTSLRSFLSSLLLKLKRFGYFLFYYIFSSWRDFTLWSVVWFFFFICLLLLLNLRQWFLCVEKVQIVGSLKILLGFQIPLDQVVAIILTVGCWLVGKLEPYLNCMLLKFNS